MNLAVDSHLQIDLCEIVYAEMITIEVKMGDDNDDDDDDDDTYCTVTLI